MILSKLNNLELLRKKYPTKIIGLCHGVFDVLHDGHINHINFAKTKCDILVVSITADSFVNKGPLQPYKKDTERSNILNSLKNVDYVYINFDFTPVKIIEALRPNIYFKGLDYNNKKKDFSKNILREEKAVKKVKGILLITKTPLKSSTNFLNKHLLNWKVDQKKYLIEVNKRYSFEDIIKIFDKINKETINIIGETIIDEFKVADIVGLTSKESALSGIIKKTFQTPGGALAAALVASEFSNNINFFSYGKFKYFDKYLKNKKNIRFINLSSKSNVQIKTRYINFHRKQKIIQVSNFIKSNFSIQDQDKMIKILKNNKIKNLIICDFGSGLFESRFISFINKSYFKKYLNVQSNSLNFGHNLFHKYKKKNLVYISLDEKEWCLGLNINPVSYNSVLANMNKNINSSITLGVNGSIYVNKSGINKCPVFISNPVDTTGCGDAYFILTSLLKMVDCEPLLIPFLGNIYAGLYSRNIGNVVIKKDILLGNIKSLMNFS